MQKLLEKHAKQVANLALLDVTFPLHETQLVALSYSAWDPDNFFKVWTYMFGRVSYGGSSPLGQYYMHS